MTVSALSTKDFQAILDIVHMVNEDQSEVEICRQVLAGLGALMGCESVGYARVELATGTPLSATHEPDTTDFSRLPGFNVMFHQHPGFAAYRGGQMALGTSTVLSDLADLRSLRRLPLYVDYYEPNMIRDQMFCLISQSGQQGAVLSFDRANRGFFHRDRAVGDLIKPHLIQAVARRRRVASLSAAVRSLGRHANQIEQAGPRLSLLTSREREVVEQLVGGLTDREIARSLVISPRTVHKHLESIYRKVAVRNRASLIGLIHQANDDPPPPNTPRRREAALVRVL